MSSEIGLGGVAQLEEPQMGVEMKGPESEDDLLTSSPWEPVESFLEKAKASGVVMGVDPYVEFETNTKMHRKNEHVGLHLPIGPNSSSTSQGG